MFQLFALSLIYINQAAFLLYQLTLMQIRCVPVLYYHFFKNNWNTSAAHFTCLTSDVYYVTFIFQIP